jgi:aspartate/methionine/tyrosine aminotransferase
MADIEPFFVMEIQRRALQLEAEGRSVIHLEIGQPDFGAPEPVLRRAQEALGRPGLGYTDAPGTIALRERIAGWYAQRFGLPVDPQRILVTAGASGAFMVLLGSLVSPGDEFLVPDPGYPCNRHFLRMFEGHARLVRTQPENGFQPTLGELEAAWVEHSRGLILASPANPTGTCISAQALAEIHQWLRARGGVLIMDEIYQGLTYEGEGHTALALGDDVFVINSFSKYFGMTGWRLGWLVCPPDLTRALERFAQNAYICPPALAQEAALEAFSEASIRICEAHRAQYRERRDWLLGALAPLGFQIPARPAGAFYIYLDCSRFGRTASALSADILDKTGVALTPGRDFGQADPERYIRLAYAQAQPQLEAAVARLSDYLRR